MKTKTKPQLNFSSATTEKEVEHIYWSWFEKELGTQITSPNNTDGILICDGITSLFEFKYDCDIKNRTRQMEIVIQSIVYLKNLHASGTIFPKSIFIGDKTGCFCVSTNKLANYLELDYQCAPSDAAKVHSNIVLQMVNDDNILPFIYNLKTDASVVIDKLKAFERDEGYLVKITPDNIADICGAFSTNAIKDLNFFVGTGSDTDALNASKVLTDVFINCLTDPVNTYIHPKKKNILVSNQYQIYIDPKEFKSFFANFAQDYKQSELEEIVQHKDLALFERYRSHTGAYFTPIVWVDYAHKKITETLGSNWKDEFVVWDCACGTANLTQGYKFKELYMSTLSEGDISTIKDMKFNPGSESFTYDFLSEIGLDSPSIPANLKLAFANKKKILFLLNPPYATSGVYGGNGDHKKNITQTVVNDHMAFRCSNELYAQFIYKIMKLSEINPNVHLAIYTKLFLGCPSYQEFLKYIRYTMDFKSAFMFPAKEFNNVSKSWGVMFSMWTPKSGLSQVETIQPEYKVELNTHNKKEYTVDCIGVKTITYNPNRSSNWVSEPIKKLKKVDAPQLKNYMNVSSKGTCKIVEDGFGYMYGTGGPCWYNRNDVALVSSAYASACGAPIAKENFIRVCALLTARQSIGGNWINYKDEYLRPNEKLYGYDAWSRNSIIYSIFNPAANQSSLRNINYKSQLWDIRNQFFFMSHDEMMQLANQHNFVDMWQDCKQHTTESYVYGWLKFIFKAGQDVISEDANAVLDAARNLIRLSFTERIQYSKDHPEYHLHSWDAGWAQLKPLFYEKFPDEYNKFLELFRKFETTMIPGVYKFGFLPEPYT